MVRACKFASAGVFALLTVSFVEAQQQGQAQNQNNQTGKATSQQQTYQPGFGQNPWFANQGVRQQLNLTEQQFNQLNSAYGNAWKGYQQGYTGLDNKLSNDARWQKMMEFNQGFNKSFSPAINDVFTDAKQRERFNQLHLQYQGFSAFADPTVQSNLKLTPAQQQKLNQYGQQWYQQMGDIGQSYQTNPDVASKRFNEMWKQYGEQVNSVLTPEQQRTWSQMVGEPYTFQPNIFFQTGNTGNTGGIPK